MQSDFCRRGDRRFTEMETNITAMLLATKDLAHTAAQKAAKVCFRSRQAHEAMAGLRSQIFQGYALTTH
jgi:hypothetical protein